MTDCLMGTGNQYIQLVKVLNCKLPTISYQLATSKNIGSCFCGFEYRPQTWEMSVLPLCHCGPLWNVITKEYKIRNPHTKEWVVLVFTPLLRSVA